MTNEETIDILEEAVLNLIYLLDNAMELINPISLSEEEVEIYETIKALLMDRQDWIPQQDPKDIN